MRLTKLGFLVDPSAPPIPISQKRRVPAVVSGAPTIEPGISLAQIAATATSIRIHAAQPTTYAGTVASTIGIKSFSAASLFSLKGQRRLLRRIFPARSSVRAQRHFFRVQRYRLGVARNRPVAFPGGAGGERKIPAESPRDRNVGHCRRTTWRRKILR